MAFKKGGFNNAKENRSPSPVPQYRVFLPLALLIESRRRGTLSAKFRTHAAGICCHASCRAFRSSRFAMVGSSFEFMPQVLDWDQWYNTHPQLNGVRILLASRIQRAPYYLHTSKNKSDINISCTRLLYETLHSCPRAQSLEYENISCCAKFTELQSS